MPEGFLEAARPLPYCVPLEGRVERTASVSADPIGRLSAATAARILATLAGFLTAQQVQVIRMRYYGSRTFQEIGDEMGISVHAAYRIHQRALQSLRKRLEEMKIRSVEDLI